MKDLKVVFMGTPEFAVSILESLIENVDVVMVVSQPDKPVGRKRVLTPSPVKVCALDHGIKVFAPDRIRSDFKEIVDAEPDMIVTCAYGQIIPKELIELPKYGCINVHASLLPKYRGGAPIHRAIIEGEKETGITIMYMDEGMDSGDIITKRVVPISEEDTLDTLSKELATVGSELLIETIPSIIDGTNERIVQDEKEVTFGYVITKEDELIDFNSTSLEIYNKIRGLNSNPGAYFILEGKHIKVYASTIGDKKGTVSRINNVYEDGLGIGTKDGEIIITEIKPEGKNKIAVKDNLHGKDKSKLRGMTVNDRVD